MILDAHTHVGTDPDCPQPGDALLSCMDANGVDRAVIFPFITPDMNNRPIADLRSRHPDRFLPFCAVDPRTSDAVTTVRDCLADGFMGIKLHPSLHGYHLSNPGLVDPLFELAEDFGVPVLAHGAAELHNCPPEFALMALRFPNVSLIMAHMGYFTSTSQAIRLAAEHGNLYLDTSRVPLFETRKAVAALGPAKVIWGTDAPYVDYPGETDKLRRAADRAEDIEMIGGGVMAALLKLNT